MEVIFLNDFVIFLNDFACVYCILNAGFG